ncbi:hypothetical protein ES703_21699 [subsurface metagenome]
MFKVGKIQTVDRSFCLAVKPVKFLNKFNQHLRLQPDSPADFIKIVGVYYCKVRKLLKGINCFLYCFLYKFCNQLRQLFRLTNSWLSKISYLFAEFVPITSFQKFDTSLKRPDKSVFTLHSPIATRHFIFVKLLRMAKLI